MKFLNFRTGYQNGYLRAIDGCNTLAYTVNMNTPVTAIRLPVDLKAKLEKIAEKDNRSLSNLIVTMLEKALETKTRG